MIVSSLFIAWQRVWARTLALQLDMNTFFRHLKLSTLDNSHCCKGLVVAGRNANLLNLVDDVVAFEDFTKDYMLAI